jgi:GTP-binding protein EngB required for normal cell division
VNTGVQTGADPALAGALAALAEVAGRLGAAEVGEQVGEAAGRLAALVLEVAVVGECKRGKSSLLNALLGREVLPVGVLPLTAVPTVLERGQEGLLVEYADGRRQRHALDQVARFVTEDANPANTLGVTRVTARLHAPLLDDGVRLVDTPGVGSVHDHNTLTTDAYLPSLDAAVLVTCADPPISKAERAFLKRVLEHAVRLFVVLNKADYLTPGDLDQTVALTGRVVRQTVPGWPGPVYALSARPGTGDPHDLRRFQQDLERFLGEERAAAVTDAATRSATRALGSLRLAVDLERRAATLPATELAARRALCRHRQAAGRRRDRRRPGPAAGRDAPRADGAGRGRPATPRRAGQPRRAGHAGGGRAAPGGWARPAAGAAAGRAASAAGAAVPRAGRAGRDCRGRRLPAGRRRGSRTRRRPRPATPGRGGQHLRRAAAPFVPPTWTSAWCG